MSPQPTTTYTDDRGRWYVELKILRCPNCGAKNPPPQRGKVDNGDGTYSRPHICTVCAARITAIIK
jgi:hypothetical protein